MEALSSKFSCKKPVIFLIDHCFLLRKLLKAFENLNKSLNFFLKQSSLFTCSSFLIQLKKQIVGFFFVEKLISLYEDVFLEKQNLFTRFFFFLRETFWFRWQKFVFSVSFFFVCFGKKKIGKTTSVVVYFLHGFFQLLFPQIVW